MVEQWFPSPCVGGSIPSSLALKERIRRLKIAIGDVFGPLCCGESQMKKARSYADEYRATHGTEKGKKDRAARNKARREAEKKGLVKKGDGREIDHKNFRPRDNRPSNLRVVSKKTNREKQPKRK